MAKKAYIGVDGKARKIKKGYIGVEETYTVLDYIQSSGAQYLDTGFKPNGNTRVVMDIEVTAGVTSFLFGARNNSSAASGSNSFSLPQISGASLRSDYGSTETAIAVSPVQRLRVDKNKNVTTVNGTTASNTEQTFSCSYSLFLLSVNTTGSAYGTQTSAKLYSCQIYDDGTMVRDYVPARGDGGAVGLYDRVNGVFYENKGTGSFTAGSETGERISCGVARNIKKAYIGIGGGATYREVEYIQSAGTQYIDTRFKPNNNTRVVIDIEAAASHDTKTIFGARVSYQNTDYTCWYISDTRIQTDYGNVAATFNVDSIKKRYTIDKNKNVTTMGEYGVTTTENTFQSTYAMYLFGMNQGGSIDSRMVSAKLYSCQIYDNGTLVRDYVPAIDSSGNAGLFDKKNRLFYANAGSGSFTAGAETGATFISSGAARPCWTCAEPAYYGTVTELTTGKCRHAAASLGEYALFAGGSVSSGVSLATEYYNAQLVKGTATSLTEGRERLAAAVVGNYALFGGGIRNGYDSDTVDAYSTTLTIHSTAGLASPAYNLGGASNGVYALFGGGYYGGAITTVRAFNNSLSATNATSLSNKRSFPACANVGKYALFAGGYVSSSATNAVEAYDTSLTKKNATALSSVKSYLAGASIADYALFGGGWQTGATLSAVVDAYNASLTRTKPTGLSVARQYLTASAVNGFAFFGGGFNASLNTSGALGTVDAYDASLTRTTMPDLSVGRGYLAAAAAGDYVLFAGGSNTSTLYKRVDAYVVA